MTLMHDIRQNKNNIVIIDGTLSRLDRGFETHCGKLFKLTKEVNGARRNVIYDPGVQGDGLSKWINVATGNGLNRSIIKTYRRLSEHYHEGDKNYLFGYSRGAYAVRLLAGMINRLGLLKPEFATRAIAEQAFLLFAKDLPSPILDGFISKYNTAPVSIEFLGVWDTVKALGLPIPFLHRYTPMGVNFRNSSLPSNVKLGCQALAYHENRKVYRPILWTSRAPNSDLKQLIFAGTHSIVGGQSYKISEARYLSAFPLHWMFNEAIKAGLELPTDWKSRHPAKLEINIRTKDMRNRGLWRRERRRFYPVELFKDHQSLKTFRERKDFKS